MTTTIVHVIIGTKADAEEYRELLELPRDAVLSYRQARDGALRGRLARAIAVPPLGSRLIDLPPRALFPTLSVIDLHNVVVDDTRRMDAVHASRAARHDRKAARA